MEEITYKHSLPIQLRFNDVDKFGHVNNTVFFSFYDLGKTEYFTDVCPHVDWDKAYSEFKAAGQSRANEPKIK